MSSKEPGLIKRNHLLHALILLVAILVAYLRHESLPDSDLGKGFLVLEVSETLETSISETYLLLKAKVIDGDFPEIYNRAATVKLYGAKDLEPGTIELEGKAKIKANRVYISAHYTDIYNFKPKKRTFRDKLLERVDEKIEDENTKNLFKTFILGEPKDVLNLSLQSDFYLTGLVHLLVVSGFHTSILAVLLRYLLPGKYGLLASLAGVCFYALLIVSLNPPVFRASLMIVFVILIKLLNARHDILSVLLLSVYLILFVTPELLFSYSLWLSFFATLYIVLALRNFQTKNKLIIPFWVSLFAFLGTAPLISTFSYNTPFAILFSPILSPAFFAFGVYGFVNLFTFLSLPIFPLELVTHLIVFVLNMISKYSLLLNINISIGLALFLLVFNATLIYLTKGYYKLSASAFYLWFAIVPNLLKTL